MYEIFSGLGENAEKKTFEVEENNLVLEKDITFNVRTSFSSFTVRLYYIFKGRL